MEIIPQHLKLDRKASKDLYLQLCDQIIELLQRGQIPGGSRLPGTRQLAAKLGVHRNTVSKAVEELEAQGWVDIVPNRGVFVVKNLPKSQTKNWQKDQEKQSADPFQFYDFPELSSPRTNPLYLGFDDGFPDVRLAPINELAAAYGRNLRKMTRNNSLYYTDGMGHPKLRNALAKMLSQTRGMPVDDQQIMITRGTQMAIRLAAEICLRPGDAALVGETNYRSANVTFAQRQANIFTLPLDKHGIVLDRIPDLCRQHPVRLIYVTPHHHHPTTVTLSAERRMRLLQLAEAHNFVILEDDYDYDFHYANRPILPLASADNQGRVLYCGSFTKALAPAFRVGYLVANEEIIKSLPKIRRQFDRQGDQILEATIADLLLDGTIKRYLRKALKTYGTRRDYFCTQLAERFSEEITFEIPSGGMAVWARFAKRISLVDLSERMRKRGFLLSDGLHYNPVGAQLNGTRMGFARLNQTEIDQCLQVLREEVT